MTEYAVVIDGNLFVAEAGSRREAWKLAIAKAAVMSRKHEINDEDVYITVMTEKEAKKARINLLFADVLNADVFKEYEALRRAAS